MKRRVPDFARSSRHTIRSSGGKYEFHGIGGGDEQLRIGGKWCRHVMQEGCSARKRRELGESLGCFF
jgi:hypothetical protein